MVASACSVIVKCARMQMDRSSALERIVAPGEELVQAIISTEPSSTVLKIGNGLLASAAGDSIVAVKCGALGYRKPNRFFVRTACRRYVPAIGEVVVGIVSDRNAEFYRVQLHATSTAILPVLAFDGATKRNKPNLAIGAVVFARVVNCSRHLEPELSCQAGGAGPKKDWMTGESIFGELSGGTILSVSCNHAERLFNPSCAVLSSFGTSVPFEVAVGLNGSIWLRAKTGMWLSTREVLAILLV
jgi:exosome complex component RRP40